MNLSTNDLLPPSLCAAKEERSIEERLVQHAPSLTEERAIHPRRGDLLAAHLVDKPRAH